MSKSKKIGVIIFVVVIILIIVFSYLYLAGNFPKTPGYKVDIYFTEASELKKGSLVVVRGLEKGKVDKVEISDDNQMVHVRIIIDKDIKLTEDTKFAIRSLSYFGTDRILSVTPGTGPEVSKTTKFYGINEVIQLEKVFFDLENLIAKLESVPIEKRLHEIKTELYSKIDTLTQGLTIPLISVAEQIEILVKRFDSLSVYLKQEGTVNKLVTSQELYQEVRDTNQKLKELLEDIKANPKKYFTIKIF